MGGGWRNLLWFFVVNCRVGLKVLFLGGFVLGCFRVLVRLAISLVPENMREKGEKSKKS